MKIYDYTTLGGKNLILNYIEKLPIEPKVKALQIRRMIEDEGVNAFTKLNTRRLFSKLYEIKFSNQRIAYVIVGNEYVYFLHIFQKQKNKTERNDIDLAIERAKRKGVL